MKHFSILAAATSLVLTGPIIALLPGQLLAQDAQGHGSAEAQKAEASAAAAMKAMKLEAGLKIEVFATEPLLGNPVAFAPDEKGRWYIAETYRQERGVEDNRAHMNWLDDDLAARTVEDRLAMIRKFYPDEAKFAEKFTKFEDRIVRVEDSNGDGRADQRTIFAEGFRDPLDGTGAGIIVRNGEVWWTCIPHLWRFSDPNNDGVADTREKLLSGFGVKFAFRGHDMHGLRFGPDGKLYFSIGDRGINVTSKEGPRFELPETGSVMRCNPDGTGFEVFATGLRNPQELAFNEFGDLFTGDNNSDAGDKARFVHVLEGGDSGWRMAFQYRNDRGPWNRERLWDEKQAPKAKYLVPPIANIADGPSGLTFNPGSGLSAKYNGHFFLSDFRGGAGGSIVHDIVLEPNGAGWKIKQRKDLVKGILTTDCEFGPDGGLYVLDWVESWGGVNKGRIYKITDGAADKALQEETKRLIEEGFAQRNEEELGKLIAHADQRVRLGAQFALAAKGAAPALVNAAQKGANTLARLHGIWGLGQLAEKEPNAIAPVAPLLGDGDAEVRAQAAKVLGERRFTAAAEKLTELLKDPAPRVRYFAAVALGKLGHKAAFDPLCALAAENNDKDPILRHGVVMGLAGVADAEQLAGKAGDGSVAVRSAAVLALRKQRSPQIAAFLKDQDESVLLEAARAIHDLPIDDAMPALAELTAEKKVKNPRILERAINARYRLGGAPHAQALAAYAADGGAPETSRRDALDALSEWGNPSPRDRVLNLWRPLPQRSGADAAAAINGAIPALLKSGSPGIQEIAAKVAVRLGIAAAGDPLAELAIDEKAAPSARIAALHALAALKNPRLAEGAHAAVKSPDARLRAEGLRSLAGGDPAAAAKMIAEIISKGSTIEKQGAVAALAQLKNNEAKNLLRQLMDNLITGNLPGEIQLDVYEAAKQAGLNDLTQKYKASLPATDDLAPYRLSLLGGDAERGKKIFREHQVAQCFKCHKCEGGDSLVGPDLTKIGAAKDRAYLLESIVLPNKRIAEGFQIVVLTLKDGNVVAGRLLKEDDKQVQIETTDPQGKATAVTVDLAQVASRTSAPSPMPETIREQLSRSELRDLVEYMATRK